jgi:PAS domain S-box-containing protein
MSTIASSLSLQILDHSRDAIMLMDANLKVSFFNKRFRQLFLASPDSLPPTTLSELFFRFPAQLFSGEGHAKRVEEEFYLQPMGGKSRWCRIRVELVREEASNAFVVFITDISKKISFRKHLHQKVHWIDELCKSGKIRSGDFSGALNEILLGAAKGMGVARVNAWLIDSAFTQIRCMGHVHEGQVAEPTDTALLEKDYPHYFELLQTEQLIAVNDAMQDERTMEFTKKYFPTYGISSMLDIPVRIEGRMVGVVCFENTGPVKHWDIVEQKFGYAIAQSISLALETYERKSVEEELKQSLADNILLLNELKHRMKNNFSILASLLRLNQNMAKDEFHQKLFEECLSRVYSFSEIHDLLYSGSAARGTVPVDSHIRSIVNRVGDTFPHLKNKTSIQFNLCDREVDYKIAVPLGLMVNEIVTNAYKHAFSVERSGRLEVLFNENKDGLQLLISDNGPGLGKTAMVRGSGYDILEGLSEQVGGSIAYADEKGGYKVEV